jgi:cytoskeletal protein CcmA (bactofilin family)
MVKASSLFYAIAIALIIALVSSSLILFAYLNRLQVISCFQTEQLQRNASSGLAILMSDQNMVGPNDRKVLDLYDKGSDSIALEKRSWGLFEIAIATAFSGNKKNTQIVQIGIVVNNNQTALYMADQDKPLSLCGNTLIKGVCYLPKAGVKRAYIEGQSFSGNKLIEGSIKESQKNLPEIKKEHLDNIVKMAQQVANTNEEEKETHAERQYGKDTLINSFENKTIVLVSNTTVRLDHQCYEGNILVISKKNIIIGAGASLQDIILFAPRIEIEANFKGTLQAFASDTILLAKKCTLTYPSVVGLIGTGKTRSPLVFLMEGAEVKGVVFALQESLIDQAKQVKMVLEKNAKVSGQVYTNGVLDLKGIVYGSVFCSSFILNTPSSIYENHLLNATIDNSKLSSNYVGMALNEKVIAKKIAKWLY